MYKNQTNKEMVRDETRLHTVVSFKTTFLCRPSWGARVSFSFASSPWNLQVWYLLLSDFTGSKFTRFWSPFVYNDTHFWLFRDHPVLIRVFSQFRFRCSTLRQVKFVSGVVSKSCWYASVWLVRGHAVLIRGFTPFLFDSFHCTFSMNILRTLPNLFWEKTHGQRRGKKEDGKNNSQKPLRRSLTDYVNVVQPK